MQSWTKSVKLTEPVMQSIGVFDASVLHSYRLICVKGSKWDGIDI
jgi:hypothetical protein